MCVVFENNCVKSNSLIKVGRILKIALGIIIVIYPFEPTWMSDCKQSINLFVRDIFFCQKGLSC